ncbi:MAG: FtsQ-type POTRA domain-containing protein [Candidatus Marinimicrobia bacterium]|nr:FtsQ-type POTRA domain-containing protein [Candidatus Neomarinimicrobiota bacterium]
MKTEQKDKFPIFKIICRIGIGILLPVFFVLLIRGSNSWCSYTDVFDISHVNIQGNTILTDLEILQIANIQLDTCIKSLNLASIQKQLETNPYVRAAAISRDYPSHVNILISERVPICYISHKGLFLADAEGIVLPIPKRSLGTNLPVISGFESDSLDYFPGYYIPNESVQEIIYVISGILNSAPNLYSEISEIHHWKNDNYILYTVKSGTPIYLGNKSLPEQLNILANFQTRLNGKRHLSDYQYLDLRWNKQIVAKERRS